MSEVNIQTLFAQLRLEQMLAYLPRGGWYGAPERNADRIRFERANGHTPFVLLLPRSNRSRNAKRLLQTAIYTLCDVEDRQPAEIIRDILAAEIAQAHIEHIPPGTSANEFRLRLSNDNALPIMLHVAERPGGCLLMPGESIEFVTQPPEGGSLDISIQSAKGQ